MRHLRSLSSSGSFLAIAALLSACSGSSAPSSTGTEPPTPSTPGATTVTVDGTSVPVAKSAHDRSPASSVSSSTLAGAVTANNAFALDLYSRLRGAPATSGGTNQGTNLLTSPISASLALTMTYAGAQGTTESQMATALHYGSAASDIFEGQNALSQALAGRAAAALANDTMINQEEEMPAPSPSDYELTVVNSVWGQSTYTWNTPFLDILAEDYGTGVYLQDFVTSYDPARVLINDWVADNTNDKIENLLPEGSLDQDTRMVLVNAIHLKLPWANPFDPSQTAPSSFTTASGSTVQNPFMNMTGTFNYTDDGEAQIIGLPLSNAQVAVVVALPHGDLATYEAGLTASSAGIAYPTSQNLVSLSLPKTSFTSPTFSLADELKAMGMPIAFDPQNANFSGLCSNTPDGDTLYISDVLQKAMIAMQETGVEAAAATAVIIAGASVASSNPPQPIPMNVDKPYVLSIVDVPTGALLFLGHITDPTM